MGIRAGSPDLQHDLIFAQERLQDRKAVAFIRQMSAVRLFELRKGLLNLISRQTYVASEV